MMRRKPSVRDARMHSLLQTTMATEINSVILAPMRKSPIAMRTIVSVIPQMSMVIYPASWISQSPLPLPTTMSGMRRDASSPLSRRTPAFLTLSRASSRSNDF
jgi:hypothetical protein